MSNTRKPLKKSISIGCVLFIAALCLLLGIVNYFRYERMQYRRYEEYIENLLRYAASAVDTDDLAECIRTGRESERYWTLQNFLDRMKDTMNIHYLYIIIPRDAEPPDNMIDVLAAMNGYEYEYEPETQVHLNNPSGNGYPPSAAKKYLNAYNSGNLSFFEEKSEWGDDYTGLLPLYDSNGEKIAALCVDINIEDIQAALWEQIGIVLFFTILLGVLFIILFIRWCHINITQPLELLEASVAAFAYQSHGSERNPDALVLHVPPIHTGNEVEFLAHAVSRMGQDMRDSVRSMLSTERELARLNIIAHRDSLTNVGNKAAYMQYAEELDRSIQEKRAVFALLMADTNRLKYINDTFGHEKGDIYLKNCCNRLCNIYLHSPVFRTGGDEFLVVLVGRDYEDRNQLIRKAEAEFEAAEANMDAEPWERTSVSLGMAACRADTDRSVKEVFLRADHRMYRAKVRAHQRLDKLAESMAKSKMA